MSDFIKYDYASMDIAYDEMRRVSDNLLAQLDVLQAEAQKVLAFNGDYVTNYDGRAQVIRHDVETLNDVTTSRSTQLSDMFNDYKDTDQRLGSR